MLLRMKPLIITAIVVPLLVVCIVALTTRPGIGDVERAQSKIKNGMSKDQVLSLLGKPHREDPQDWDYWESRFVDCVLRIHFGPDDRVTSSEWWVQ